MNSIDKQYHTLLQEIIDNGVRKDDRTTDFTLENYQSYPAIKAPLSN